MPTKNATRRSKPRPGTRSGKPGRATTKPAKRSSRSPGSVPEKPARTMTLPMFQVDAFTSRRFHGNPAAVVLLEGKWLPDDLMQSIAAENNLAETAFILRGKNPALSGLRWFTPSVEVDLCGHATVAAAHVLWNHEKVKSKRIIFTSRSGKLPVEQDGDRIVLDFPSRPGKKIKITPRLCDALGREPVEAYMARDLMAVFDNKRDVHELQPDFAKLTALEPFGFIATAPGAGHDFVSRFFAPAQGINEDPATGSSHCTLIPYWAEELGKTHLTSHQVSHRAGEFFCELKGNRVRIGGHAVTFSKGTITV